MAVFTLAEIADDLMNWLVRTTWQSGLLVVAIVLIQIVAGKWIAPRWRVAMWLLVFVRLAMPVQPSSTWSTDAISPVFRNATVTSQPTPVMTVRYQFELPDPVAPVKLEKSSRASGAITTLSLLMAIWISGTFIMWVRLLLCHVRFARSLRRAVPPETGLVTAFEQCCREMGVRRGPRLVLTDQVAGPAVFGVFRPCVLLPSALVQELSFRQLRFVFLHELAHVRRCDTSVEFCAALVRGLHWFNPLAHFSLARLRAERELACDELVLRHTELNHRTEYGQTVLTIASRAVSSAAPLISMAQGRTNLKRRITMISQFRSRKWSNALPLFVLLLLASCTMTGAQSTRPPEAKPPETSSPAKTNSSESATDNLFATQANDQLKAKLTQRLPEVVFSNTSFSDALDFIRNAQDLNLYVNWEALEAAGLDRKKPVTMNLRNVTLKKVLDILMSEIGGANSPVGYQIDDGVLTISTRDHAALFVTRAYDIRDLTLNASSPPTDAALPPTPESQDPRRIIIEQVSSLILETISVGSWKEDGGQLGSLRELGGQLIITQTPEAHDQIVRLLNLLRESRSIQVTVQSYFITLDPDQLPEGEIKTQLKKILGGIAPNTGGEKDKWLLTAAELKTVVAAAQGQKDSSVLSAPRVTLFNGMNAVIESGENTQYVSGFTRKADTAGWEAVRSSIVPGIKLQITGTVSADRKFVTLNLKPKLSSLLGMDTQAFKPEDGSDAGGAMVQVPRLWSQELDTVVSVPDGGTVLLGGMMRPVDKEQKKFAPTFILVRPTIIVQKPEISTDSPTHQ